MQDQVSEDIMNRIKRFVDEYGWDWIVVKQVINNYYGTQYTVNQIRKIYESNESSKEFWPQFTRRYALPCSSNNNILVYQKKIGVRKGGTT